MKTVSNAQSVEKLHVILLTALVNWSGIEDDVLLCVCPRRRRRRRRHPCAIYLVRSVCSYAVFWSFCLVRKVSGTLGISFCWFDIKFIVKLWLCMTLLQVTSENKISNRRLWSATHLNFWMQWFSFIKLIIIQSSNRERVV